MIRPDLTEALLLEMDSLSAQNYELLKWALRVGGGSLLGSAAGAGAGLFASPWAAAFVRRRQKAEAACRNVFIKDQTFWFMPSLEGFYAMHQEAIYIYFYPCN